MEEIYIRLFFYVLVIIIFITIYFYNVTKKTLEFYPKKVFPKYDDLNFIYNDSHKKEMFSTIVKELISQFGKELIIVAGELRFINDPTFFIPLKNRLKEISDKNESIKLRFIVHKDTYIDKIKELEMKGIDIKVYESLIYPRIHFGVTDKKHVYIQEFHKPGKISGEYFKKDNVELAKILEKRFNDFISEDFCKEIAL